MNPRTLAIIVISLSLVFVGCSTNRLGSPGVSPLEEYREISARHSEELSTYAALLRVKLKRQQRVDDFRVEIFSRGDDRLSLYVRGFLGSAVFKAVVSGDTLICLFPRENRYFRGRVEDLESGSLADSRHIIDLLLAFYRGNYAIADGGEWNTQMKKKGRSFDLKMVDTLQALRFDAHVRAAESYPYLQAETIKLQSRDRSLMVNIAIQSSSFNRTIPEEKFAMDISGTAAALSRDELSELLTGLSQ